MKDIEKTYEDIVDLLKERANPLFAKSRSRVIGGGSQSYGIRLSEIRKVTKKYSDVGPEVVEKLISSKVLDIQIAGIFLAGSLREPLNINICQEWIERYIDDWAVCDTFATEVVAPQLKEDDQTLEVLSSMAQSENKWARRTALVSVIKAENVKDVLASILPQYRNEKDPIVKKAILWARKP